MAVRRTRNDRKFWYCLYDPDGETMAEDGYGNETGEVIPSYETAVEMWANISPATGIAQTEQFGNLDNYDKVIVTTDMTCPIDEHSVLFIDKEPEYATGGMPLYDYIVKRVAVNLNHIAIAVRKVEVK